MSSERQRDERFFFFFFKLLLFSVNVNDILCRNTIGCWNFSDGVSIKQELDLIHTDNIREACSSQSRTQWTTIASRDRLYQFVAMSDDTTQTEIRQKLGLMRTGRDECSTGSNSMSVDNLLPSVSQGLKRWELRMLV
jgi:hypothetical protein